MKKLFGFMSIMLGLMFSTSVYADIGTVSENCTEFTIEVHDNVKAEMPVFTIVNTIENADTYIVADFSKTLVSKTNTLGAVTSAELCCYSNANYLGVYKNPDRNKTATNSTNTAPILASNSNNLYKHKCSANKTYSFS